MIGLDEFSKKQLVFVFTNEGEKLSFKNDNIIVKSADGEIKHQSTCWRISALFVVGSITITSGLIERSHKFCFPIFLMKQSLRTYDVIGFKAAGNTQLRCLQYSYDSLDIAKHITVNKILNQRAALMRQRYRGDDINEAICMLKRYASEVPAANSLQSIMGVEGAAAKLYFGHNFNNAKWVARRPRVKCDYINATLDLGYSLLFNMVESMLYYFGFDLYVGVMHREFYMRKSLVCDLVEPFRPLIDLCIRTAISHKQCKEEDFEVKNGAYKLDWANNKSYILFLLKPLLENKNEMFRYIRDYYRCFAQEKPANEFPVFEIR
jgi:CRISPR-associated protein Cas1